jgi:hypothetical protein
MPFLEAGKNLSCKHPPIPLVKTAQIKYSSQSTVPFVRVFRSGACHGHEPKTNRALPNGPTPHCPATSCRKILELKSLVQELDRAVMEERQERLVLPEGHYAFLPSLGWYPTEKPLP